MKPYKIEKPELLCDACNKQWTENKIANQDSYWVSWGLVCRPCYKEYFEKAVGDGKEELIREIKKAAIWASLICSDRWSSILKMGKLSQGTSPCRGFETSEIDVDLRSKSDNIREHGVLLPHRKNTEDLRWFVTEESKG